MRNHFLRASGTAATGGDGGGGDGGGGGATCGANDSGGTNEWAFTTAKSFFLGYAHDYTSSIDTANNISYHASTQNNKFRVRKITNTGTISWSKEITLSDWTYFEARQGHSLSNGKQIFVGPAQYGSNDYRITVICINADSTINWCKSLESTGTGDQNNYSFQSETYGIDVDSNDNIYIATKHTYHKVFKINSSGALQWFKVYKIQNESGSTLTGANAPVPTGVVVNDNYIYVLNIRRNHRYGFIYVLNTSDGSVYAKRWITNDSTYSDRDKYWNYLQKPYHANHLAIDSSSNLYVSYVCNDSSNYIRNIYLAKIDSSLNSISWSKEYNLSSSYYTGPYIPSAGSGLDVTSGVGNVVFASMVTDVNNEYNEKLIFAVFNSSGELSWQRNIVGYENTYPQPFRVLNDVKCDSADHFYITANLPYASGSTPNANYSHTQNTGEGLLKHTTCSAIAAGTEFFTLDTYGTPLPTGASGWAYVDDEEIITGETTGDFQISSSAYTDQSTYVAGLDDSTEFISGAYYTYVATSHTLSVADISSSEDIKELDHI